VSSFFYKFLRPQNYYLKTAKLQFRGQSKKDIQNKLYIFVRAEIIRPEETLAAMQKNLQRISDKNRKAFEEHEKEFQDYQSWPGVKPQPTMPNKVLDTQ